MEPRRPSWHPQKNSSNIPRNWYFMNFSALDDPQRAAAEMFKKKQAQDLTDETSPGTNR